MTSSNPHVAALNSVMSWCFFKANLYAAVLHICTTRQGLLKIWTEHLNYQLRIRGDSKTR